MAEVVGGLILGALGVAEFGTLTIFGSLTVAGAVGSVALAGGAIGLALLSAPSVQDPSVPRPSDGVQTVRAAVPARLFGYGTTRIAGAYMLYESNDTGYAVTISALHQGRIGSSPIYYYLNDDLVQLNAGGEVEGVVGSNDGRYLGGNVKITHRLGAAFETYYDEPTTLLPGGVWTQDHRGDDIASLMMVCAPVSASQFRKIYPRGLPTVSVVTALTPIFDPRDPTQSRSDPSTWRTSDNPVLQMLDYVTSAERGLGQSWDDMIAPVLDDLMVQAAICDQGVARANGSAEKRYASHGWAYMTSDPADVIAAILATCDGWMTEGGDGTLRLRVGAFIAPTITFTDAHIVGLSIEHGIADEEAVNEIRFTYTAANNDYREAAGDPWRDEIDIGERGRIRSQRLSLAWVQSHSQARRLAKRQMLRYQARLRGSITTKMYGLAALGERWVRIQSDVVADLADAVVEITRVRMDLANGRFDFEWVLVNPNEMDAWDAASDEGREPVFPAKVALIGLTAPTGVSVSYSGGSLLVDFDDPSRSDLTYATEWEPSSGGTATRTSHPSATSIGGGQLRVVIPGIASGQTLDVRIAFVGSTGAVGTFSTDVTVST